MPQHSNPPITVVPLAQADLREASELVRLAFATFIEVPEPGEFWNDRDYVHNRWNAPHSQWFKALTDDRMVGVMCVSRWGSSAIVGPVAVHPEFWDRGIARRLMAAGVEQLDNWGVTHTGLMTFPDSPKHIGLYQHFGFWPASLIAVMQRDIRPADVSHSMVHYGQTATDNAQLKDACRALTDGISPGLDLSGELDAVLEQNLGTTLMLVDANGVPVAFAVCHFGPHSEAGNGVFYVKFAAVASGPEAPTLFACLMAACDAAALKAGQTTMTVGVNTARLSAYRWLIEDGFRTDFFGISMHRGGPGYDADGIWVLDDWR